MPDVHLNAKSITTTSATTAPAAGTSETWTVTALASGIRTLVSGETYALVDATSGASGAQQAEIVRITAAIAGATSITVTRGCDNTTPVAHAASSTFNIVVVAGSIPFMRAPYYSQAPALYSLKNDFDAIRGAYNWKSSNTRILDQGLGNAMLPNGGQSEHIIIGDSVSAGAIGLIGAAYLFDRLRSWPLSMRDQLANSGIPGGGTGTVRLVDGGAGIDARMTLSANWTSFLWGGRTTVVGTYAELAPERGGNIVDVLYYDAASQVFTIAVDGAASGTNFLSVSTGGTNQWKIARLYGCTVIAGFSKVRVTATTVGAGFYLAGIGVSSANSGLIVHNVAQSGASASGTGNAAWQDNSATNVLGNIYLNAAGRKRTVTDVSTTAASNVMTSATAAFTIHDQGKPVDQINLGAGGLTFEPGSYIGQYLTATTVAIWKGNANFPTVSNALSTQSSQSFNIGRDPACVHIGLGLNDLISLGASDATIMAAITAIRNRFSNSDCILHLTNEPATTSVSTARMWTFQQELFKLADTLDVPLYDWRDRVGTFANGQANGVYGDNAVHITAATSASLGAALAALMGGGSGRTQTVGIPQLDNDVINRAYIEGRKARAAPGTQATTTVEKVIMSLPVGPGLVKVGDVFSYSAWIDPAATTVITVRVHIGPLGTIADPALIVMSATALTNAAARDIRGQVSIQVIGASATFIGGGIETVGGASAAGAAVVATSSFNSNVANYVTVSIQNTSSTTTTVYSGLLKWE